MSSFRSFILSKGIFLLVTVLAVANCSSFLAEGSIVENISKDTDAHAVRIDRNADKFWCHIFLLADNRLSLPLPYFLLSHNSQMNTELTT